MLRPKQEKFIQNIIKGMSQRQAYKEQIYECLKIYIGDYSDIQQYAATILLKMYLKEDFSNVMKNIKENIELKTKSRTDSRVIKWKKEIKKIGKCEICNSTENLIAHHIIPWEYSVSGRINASNGQCLCSNCHKMMHNDNEWLKYMVMKYGK